jgi:hypothetical protein
MKTRVSITEGGLVGSILAVVMSWIVNHSVVWAILHFFCSWIYVIYWILVKTRFYDWLVSLVR